MLARTFTSSYVDAMHTSRDRSRDDHHTNFELQTFGLSYDPSTTFSPQLSIHPQWKRELFELLENPSATTSSFLVHVISTSLIVASALVTVCETIPAFHAISSRVWFGE